jgi:pyridoxine 5'-phosphate synthase PdxJ
MNPENKEKVLYLVRETGKLVSIIGEEIDKIEDPQVKDAMKLVATIAMNSISIQRLSLQDMAETLLGHVRDDRRHVKVQDESN